MRLEASSSSKPQASVSRFTFCSMTPRNKMAALTPVRMISVTISRSSWVRSMPCSSGHPDPHGFDVLDDLFQLHEKRNAQTLGGFRLGAGIQLAVQVFQFGSHSLHVFGALLGLEEEL